MLYIDFSDTPQGSDLIEKIQKLDNEIENLQDQIDYLERQKDQLESEYDMHAEMWEDSFDNKEDN